MSTASPQPAHHLVCPRCQAINRVPSVRLGDAPVCGQCRAHLLDGLPLAVDEAAFRRHLERSDLPLVVDFWAAWCGPCRMMAPVFERAAAEWPRVRFLKVDTEAEVALAQRYAIRSIPTLAVFRGGREVARQAGALDAARLRQWLGPLLRS